jgi:RNA polymerase sigma-70 factor (ECF subfamily)
MYLKSGHIVVKNLQELLNGCVLMDRSCQKKIYEIFSPSMMILCLRYSKNNEEAEEIMQDGFIKMYKCIGQFNNRGSFEGWLRKIMINTALQRYRGIDNHSNLKVIRNEHEGIKTDFSPEQKMTEKELIQLIHTLPPAYRIVFNLYVFEGMKHREIAALLNISEGTSKSNLWGARNLLKKHLIPELKLAR